MKVLTLRAIRFILASHHILMFFILFPNLFIDIFSILEQMGNSVTSGNCKNDKTKVEVVNKIETLGREKSKCYFYYRVFYKCVETGIQYVHFCFCRCKHGKI